MNAPIFAELKVDCCLRRQMSEVHSPFVIKSNNLRGAVLYTMTTRSTPRKITTALLSLNPLYCTRFEFVPRGKQKPPDSKTTKWP